MTKKVVVLLAGVMLTLATNAMASSLLTGGNYSHNIYLLKGTQQITEDAGSIDTSVLDSRNLDYLYCVDLDHVININTTYSYTSVNNTALIHGQQLIHADKVAYLLGTYGAGGQGEKAQALQAAIWYEITDGVYHLNDAAYSSTSNVPYLYKTYVNDAANKSGDISKFVWINPGTDPTGTAVYQAQVTSAPAPEPSTIVLLVTGILGMAVFGKRRMIKAA